MNKNRNYRSSIRGFTLIELLVVISIISFLSSVVLGSLTSARVAARDAQRISDIRQIRIALELYRNTNGTYPVVSYWVNSTDTTWNVLQTALSPYMPKLPRDPVNNGTTPWSVNTYAYAYGYDPVSYPTVTTYDLVTQLENTSSPLRCGLKNWIFRVINSTWCGSYNAYIYTGEY